MFRQLYKTIRYTAAFTPRLQTVAKAERPPRVKTYDIPVDEAGNNALHQLVAAPVHANKLYRFTESNGSEKTKVMAAMTNNAGQLPIDVLVKQNEIIRNALIDLAMPANYLKLNKPISLDDLLPAYFDYSNRELLATLEVGCKIANKARVAIKESNTHPDSGIHKSQQHEISRKLDELRDQLKPLKSLNPDDMDKFSRLIEQFQVGNCSEYSLYALNQLTHEKTKYVIHGEIAHISNEDHVFIVLNRLSNSDPKNYKTWGVNAVIVDPWYGLVYPVSEIELRLAGHRSYQLEDGAFRFNILPKFNDKHHKIKILTGRVYTQSKSPQTFFSQKESRQDDQTRPAATTARLA